MNKPVKTVKDMGVVLAEMAPKLQQLLPRTVSADRLIKVALLAMQRQPKLLECSPASIFQALAECTQLQLELGAHLGQAHLVPFRDRNGQYHAQLIIGYKGLIELVLRGSDVIDVVARAVYRGDTFEYSYGLEERLVHQPADVDHDPSNLTHVYAIARYRPELKLAKFVVLSRQEIEKVRRSSRAADDGPWVEWYEEMALKTAIRRLCKTLRLTPDVARAIGRDEEVELTGAATDFGDFESVTQKPPKPRQVLEQRLASIVEVPDEQEEDAGQGSEDPGS